MDASPAEVLETEQILDDRARKLARRSEAEEAHSLGAPHLTFEVADVRFAIKLTVARRILRPKWITRVPSTPAHLRQIIQVAGRIVSVLDLERLLALDRTTAAHTNTVVLVESGARMLGVLVDELSGVARIDDDNLSSRTDAGAEDSPFVRGVTQDLVVVLDGAHLVGVIGDQEHQPLNWRDDNAMAHS